MPEPLLALEGITLAAPDGRLVFEDLDWRLERGARFHLEGGLGTGATALLRLCAGLAAPARGRVVLDGKRLDLDALDHPFLHAGSLGWVPTDGGLAVNLTLLDNIALPLRFALNLSRAEAADQARGWLDQVGLGRMADARPRVPADRVSWLVSLARAGAKGSRLWLVDRPAGGLDAASIQAAKGILTRAAQDPDVTMVTVGDAWMAALGDAVKIEDGRLAAGSPP